MDSMIATRAGKGFNAGESAALFADLTARHTGDNLVSALVYNEFATEAAATEFAAA